ncbi:hypothetical protein CKJ90_31830, partial [Klebsiella pneumoniae]
MAGGAVAAAKTRAAIDALREGLADGTLQHGVGAQRSGAFAIHAVWPEGPWLPQKRGRRSMPCGKG